MVEFETFTAFHEQIQFKGNTKLDRYRELDLEDQPAAEKGFWAVTRTWHILMALLILAGIYTVIYVWFCLAMREQLPLFGVFHKLSQIEYQFNRMQER